MQRSDDDVATFLLRPWRGTAMWRGLARAGLDVVFGYIIGFAIFAMVGLSIGFAITIIIAIPAVWLDLQGGGPARPDGALAGGRPA